MSAALLTLALLAGGPTPRVLALGAATSRGAYQAGVTYAMVRTASASLAGVAGVSAGSLNGVLGAIEHCRRTSAARSPEASPLWAAWRPMSWERLFPGERDCAAYAAEFGAEGIDCAHGLFGPGDALMTVGGLGELRRSLLELIGSTADYMPDCRVPVALSVASESPAEFRIGAQAIETSRRIVTLELRTLGTPASLAVCAIRTSTAGRGGTVVIELPQVAAPDVALVSHVLERLEALPAAARAQRGARMWALLERVARDIPPGVAALDARVEALRTRWQDGVVGVDGGAAGFDGGEAGAAGGDGGAAGAVEAARGAAADRSGSGADTLGGSTRDGVAVPAAAALDRELDALAVDADATCRRIDPLRLVELLSVSTAPIVLQEGRSVTYCGTDCAPVRHAGEWCPLGTKLCEDRLFDGAILDPQPIAAAAELRLPRPIEIAVAQLSTTDARSPAEGPVGLAFYKRLVAGVVDVAQGYELQTLSRYGQLNGVRVRTLTRSSTITGDLLYGAGAFVDQRFRRFDFHQGIIDTIFYEAADCAARQTLAQQLGVRTVPELWALFVARNRATCGELPLERAAVSMVPAAQRNVTRMLDALDQLPAGSSELRFARFVERLQDSAPEAEPETHPAISHFRHWWIEQIRQGFSRLSAWEPTQDRPLVAAEALVALSQRAVDGFVFGSPRIPSGSVGAVAMELVIPRSLTLVAAGEQGFALRWVWLSFGGFVTRDDTLSLELGAQSFIRRSLDAPDLLRFGPSLGLAWTFDDLFRKHRDAPRTDTLVLDLGPSEAGVRGHWQPSLRGEPDAALHFGWDVYVQLLDGFVELAVSSDALAPNRFSVGLAQVDALLYWLARTALGE